MLFVDWRFYTIKSIRNIVWLPLQMITGTNSSIIKCSDLFLEIKQTASHDSKTDSIGVNFAYKEEVEKFYDCYIQCVKSLQSRRSSLPTSTSITEQLSNVSISISSQTDPEFISSDHPTSTNDGENIGFISEYLDNSSRRSIDPNSSTPQTSSSSSSPSLAPVNKPKSASFSFPSSSTPPTVPLQDLFNPPKMMLTTTKTTTTTITRNKQPDQQSTVVIPKTASGRRSIRARSSSSDQRRTLTKKEGLAISLQNVEGLQNIGEVLEEETLNIIDLVNEQVVNSTSTSVLLNQTINKIYEHIQILFILTAESAASHHGSKLIQNVTELIQKGPPSMESIAQFIGPNWYNLDDVNTAGNGFTSLLYLKKSLVPTIAHLSNSVRVLGLQASLEADWMSRNRSTDPEAVVVQLACLSKELLLAIARLQMATQSFCSVCNTLVTQGNNNREEITNNNRSRSHSTADLINLWEEMKILHQQEMPALPVDGLPMKASLNQLVVMLTNENSYDSKFLKTFITTYQSFAQPKVLFTKLLERYAVPEWYTTNVSKISMIRQRVMVVLKYWIVNQSSDFDQDLVNQIYNFIDNTIPIDGYAELSKVLKDILNKLIEDREVKLELLFQMPPRIQFTEDCVLSPLELFLEWSSVSIAQQLTLIDYAIFKDVEARELLNQNFNKPKMKYRSPNVMRMIYRSTQVSFWVARLILLEGKKEKRLKVFEKIIDIAKALLKINNFNTLMSLVAGLSLTPIHRLKKTKKKLSSSATQTLAECERVFSSKKSFKTYRDILATVSSPCIPYV
ncbi:hypothetical protein SAMD00019534_122380 [Acytostelium subglobosum LB1]|uniref:hypothetical protein n=1 Tax=Acytostelium subglobosum LB1 TaxID=1410327 RepID=UPI000644CF15|nr:hypothetical protein SAMD00019534_122380 [Acytostelium subglobosum LB1]GAM29062.1 hypothetical protein SAMD00019534_122380 [Acytostelium subglobosum LB1]|eukprot:XP_012748068.1 hypothetical protein SAMD00019534_122380 [Acytostelium subglobosum LB1]